MSRHKISNEALEKVVYAIRSWYTFGDQGPSQRALAEVTGLNPVVVFFALVILHRKKRLRCSRCCVRVRHAARTYKVS